MYSANGKEQSAAGETEARKAVCHKRAGEQMPQRRKQRDQQRVEEGLIEIQHLGRQLPVFQRTLARHPLDRHIHHVGVGLERVDQHVDKRLQEHKGQTDKQHVQQQLEQEALDVFGRQPLGQLQTGGYFL